VATPPAFAAFAGVNKTPLSWNTQGNYLCAKLMSFFSIDGNVA